MTAPNELKEIKEIRVHNNDLWMEILAVALKYQRQTTKALIEKIRENDKKITDLMEKL